MFNFQNQDNGKSAGISDEDKYVTSNVVETRMLYLSTRSSQCTQLNGSMKSHVSFDLKSYLDFAGDDTIQSVTFAMPYAILVNSNYQINSTNNYLKYRLNGTDYSITVPSGNYTSDTFIPVFINLLTITSGVGFNMTLNTVTGIFTITHNLYPFYFYSASTLNYVLGFSDLIASNVSPPFQQTTFIATIAGGSNVLYINNLNSPNTVLGIGNTVAYTDAYGSIYTAVVTSQTSNNVYVLSTPIYSNTITNGSFYSGVNYGITMPRLCNFLPNPLFRICIENNSIYNGTVLGTAGNPAFSNVLASIPNTTKQNTQIVYQNFSDEFTIQLSGQTQLILAILDDNNNFVDFNGISSYFQIRIRIYRRIKKSLKTYKDVLGGATNLRRLIEEQSEYISKPIEKIL
jgi:hypothetical protein